MAGIEVQYDAERAPYGYAVIAGQPHNAQILFESNPNDAQQQLARARIVPPFHSDSEFLEQFTVETTGMRHEVTTEAATVVALGAFALQGGEKPATLRGWIGVAVTELIKNLDGVATGTHKWAVFDQTAPAAPRAES